MPQMTGPNLNKHECSFCTDGVTIKYKLVKRTEEENQKKKYIYIYTAFSTKL